MSIRRGQRLRQLLQLRPGPPLVSSSGLPLAQELLESRLESHSKASCSFDNASCRNVWTTSRPQVQARTLPTTSSGQQHSSSSSAYVWKRPVPGHSAIMKQLDLLISCPSAQPQAKHAVPPREQSLARQGQRPLQAYLQTVRHAAESGDVRRVLQALQPPPDLVQQLCAVASARRSAQQQQAAPQRPGEVGEGGVRSAAEVEEGLLAAGLSHAVACLLQQRPPRGGSNSSGNDGNHSRGGNTGKVPGGGAGSGDGGGGSRRAGSRGGPDAARQLLDECFAGRPGLAERAAWPLSRLLRQLVHDGRHADALHAALDLCLPAAPAPPSLPQDGLPGDRASAEGGLVSASEAHPAAPAAVPVTDTVLQAVMRCCAELRDGPLALQAYHALAPALGARSAGGHHRRQPSPPTRRALLGACLASDLLGTEPPLSLDLLLCAGKAAAADRAAAARAAMEAGEADALSREAQGAAGGGHLQGSGYYYGEPQPSSYYPGGDSAAGYGGGDASGSGSDFIGGYDLGSNSGHDGLGLGHHGPGQDGLGGGISGGVSSFCQAAEELAAAGLEVTLPARDVARMLRGAATAQQALECLAWLKLPGGIHGGMHSADDGDAFFPEGRESDTGGHGEGGGRADSLPWLLGEEDKSEGLGQGAGADGGAADEDDGVTYEDDDISVTYADEDDDISDTDSDTDSEEAGGEGKGDEEEVVGGYRLPGDPSLELVSRLVRGAGDEVAAAAVQAFMRLGDVASASAAAHASVAPPRVPCGGSAVVFDALLEGCCRRGMYPAARAVHDVMRGRLGINPSPRCMHALLRCMIQHDEDEARHVSAELAARGGRPALAARVLRMWRDWADDSADAWRVLLRSVANIGPPVAGEMLEALVVTPREASGRDLPVHGSERGGTGGGDGAAGSALLAVEATALRLLTGLGHEPPSVRTARTARVLHAASERRQVLGQPQGLGDAEGDALLAAALRGAASDSPGCRDAPERAGVVRGVLAAALAAGLSAGERTHAALLRLTEQPPPPPKGPRAQAAERWRGRVPADLSTLCVAAEEDQSELLRMAMASSKSAAAGDGVAEAAAVDGPAWEEAWEEGAWLAVRRGLLSRLLRAELEAVERARRGGSGAGSPLGEALLLRGGDDMLQAGGTAAGAAAPGRDGA